MLYTGKGDKGTTKLFNTPEGERIPKTHPVFEALGTVDELVGTLGMLKVHAAEASIMIDGMPIASVIHGAQENLFVLQAELAGAGMSIHESKVTEASEFVDRIEKELPPIKTFFIAGGTLAGAQADVCRAISRRMERALLRAADAGVEISASSLAYANRLSSVLYACARYANYCAGVADTPPSYKSQS